ncbi:uncharacterized protein BDZ99DRAFT_457734 [Mytilinidion resinicola]|uniref:Uncharacterized protein n=1 Tax=Mytilinidion resinicola TaxID=574789 RepID=A0A6A6Z417_9PEZI|nr:uncharacterized protein BDZ99DRAFT_457734 [Mytilinidion resinicola]KAF2815780.1 hypothetical protein BDZ99DRAFT_457734 [Mytilinidion resinicola]
MTRAAYHTLPPLAHTQPNPTPPRYRTTDTRTVLPRCPAPPVCHQIPNNPEPSLSPLISTKPVESSHS